MHNRLTSSGIDISPARPPEVAEVVDEGFVEEVRDGETGEIHRSADFLKRELRDVNRLRGEQEDLLRMGKPRFRCSYCGIGVLLRLSKLHRWYFRHDEEDGSCRYQTKGSLSQDSLDARRYNGQKEGPQHIRMKRLIRESLRCDKAFDQESVREEQRWYGLINPDTWKVPDIQGKRNGLRIAFEVQLSSTYVNVMRERRAFYLKEGGLLFWVLPRILEEERRQFQDDVLYPNNCNIFAIDDETVALSAGNGELTLRCGYLEPIRDGWELKERWRESLVRFSELTLDVPSQRVFYFDYDRVRVGIENDLRTINGRCILERFEELLHAKAHFQPDIRDQWSRLKHELPKDFKWPIDLYGGGFFTALDVYLSARAGKPVGWNFASLMQTAHRALDKRPDFLPLVEASFRQFGRTWMFDDRRYQEKWKAKRAKVMAEGAKSQQTQLHLARLRHYRSAMEWLMPEVKPAIAAVLAQFEPSSIDESCHPGP